MHCLGVLADDLTGAMDSGVKLIKKGFTVKVSFETENLTEMSNSTDILIVDTESRNISSKRSYKRVKRCSEELKVAGCPLIFKKIDSTLRGNIGSELEAVLSANKIKCVILSPGLPFNKRTTINGVHFVNGIQLQDTELAHDPFSPIYESNILRIIAKQSRIKSELINIETLRSGKEQTINLLKKHIMSGAKIIVVDAIDDGDLSCIAQIVDHLNDNIMLCGSAGLFQYISSIINNQVQHNNKIRCFPRRKSGNPVLTLSGSPAHMSKTQIERAVNENPRVSLVKMNTAVVLKGGDKEVKEKARVVQEVIELLKNGRHVIVDAAGDGKAEILLSSAGDRERLDRESETIQNILSTIAQKALKNVKLRGVVLFGGDTAMNVCRALGARGIEIIKEIEPFVPTGLLIGGEYNDLPVVTKSGGFGKEKTLVSIIKMLE